GLYFSDGKFEITIFNDLHMGDKGSWDGARPKGDWSNEETINVMNRVLDSEPSTNLAVLNGDLLSCEWVREQDTYGLLDQVMAPLLNRKLPFATTFGNHDWAVTCNTQTMTDYIWKTANKDSQLTFTTSLVHGNTNLVGTSNYYIPVYTKEDGIDKLTMLLWFFDSKGGFKYTGDGRDNGKPENGVKSYVHEDVSNLQHQNDGRYIPSLIFVHIPILVVHQYGRAIKYDTSLQPGVYGDSPDVQDGELGISLLNTLAETPNILGVFSGHLHRNDWCWKWTRTPDSAPTQWPKAANGNGLNLCFGRHTGYNGYSNVMRGGRHIVIHQAALGGDNAMETWNRLEDGTISGKVMLNSTYGQDCYPTVAIKESPPKGNVPAGRSNMGI
ncbi:Metallo-dependent phosphatase, partial [Bimuria novae-zelandiae CBS 107.79]